MSKIQGSETAVSWEQLSVDKIWKNEEEKNALYLVKFSESFVMIKRECSGWTGEQGQQHKAPVSV